MVDQTTIGWFLFFSIGGTLALGVFYLFIQTLKEAKPTEPSDEKKED